MNGRVLIIAGSDSGGGAGIQADIKTITALGGFAMTAVTALTVQNTMGVHGTHEVPSDFVKQQIKAVVEDLGVDSIKIGMLHRTEIIEDVAETLADISIRVPVVLDPVMIAKGGASLLEEPATIALADRLLPSAYLITPNVPEASVLTGVGIDSLEDFEIVARMLREKGAQNILMKGGHLKGNEVVDLLFEGDTSPCSFAGPRINSRNTHGTGCSLASACAVGLAQGLSLQKSVERAHAYVRLAIKTAPGFGSGFGPLNHGHTVAQF